MIGSLRLVQNTGSTGKSAAQLIADEKCSAALDDTGEDTSLQSVDYSDTTWALLFNSAEDSVFADQELRQALAGIARENVDVPSSGLYTAAEGLVPTGLSVDGIDYRKSARNPLPTITDPLYIVPECTAGHGQLGFFRRDHPAAEGSRPDRTGRADQRRMAEGLLPFLLGGRGSAGGVRQTPLQRAVTPLRWLPSAPKAAAYTRCCSSSRPRAAA